MNTKRAILRLFVAVTGLVASLFELAGAFMRLATAVVERAARRVQAPQVSSFATAPTVVAEAPTAPVAASKLARVTVAMTGDERLTSALMSLGFRAANVRAFAASTRGRTESLEELVKEGIVALSVN